MMTEALPLSHVSFCLPMARGYCHITVTVSSFAMLDLDFDTAMTCQDLHLTVEMVAAWMQGMSLADGCKFSYYHTCASKLFLSSH